MKSLITKRTIYFGNQKQSCTNYDAFLCTYFYNNREDYHWDALCKVLMPC